MCIKNINYFFFLGNLVCDATPPDEQSMDVTIELRHFDWRHFDWRHFD